MTNDALKCRAEYSESPRCYSPMACATFGYCRERNFKDGLPDEETRKRWQAEDGAQ